MKMNTKDTPSDIILKALAEGDREHGMDISEITEATGLDIPTASAAMTRLEATKQVRTKEVKGVGLLYILTKEPMLPSQSKVSESNPGKNAENPLKCSHCPRTFTSSGRRVQHEECCKKNPKNKAGGEDGESTSKKIGPEERANIGRILMSELEPRTREATMKTIEIALNVLDKPGITSITIRTGGKEISIRNIDIKEV
jgi:hypothetical protein